MRNNAQEGGVKMFFERYSVLMIVTVRLAPVKFQAGFKTNATRSPGCNSIRSKFLWKRLRSLTPYSLPFTRIVLYCD